MDKVSDAPARLRVLTPFTTPNLRGDYCAVLSPLSTVPEDNGLRGWQWERTRVYMTEGLRNAPAQAPRYIVTSFGQVIGWVSLDGRTHIAETWINRASGRHVAMLREAWPEAFTMDGMGDPKF